MPRVRPLPAAAPQAAKAWAQPDHTLKGPWSFRTKERVICLCEGGTRCWRENPARQRGGNAIPGLHSNWVGPQRDVLAMARPWESSIRTHRLLDAFHKHNIGMILNLQEVGEHASCGPGNLQASGFTYNPETFMAAGVGVYPLSWRDMGVPSLGKMMDIVQVMDHVTRVEGRRIAVHCHAGLGRTGLAIACFMVFTRGLGPGEAIRAVRADRHGALQTRKQELFVYVFEQFLRYLRCVLAEPRGQTGDGEGAVSFAPSNTPAPVPDIDTAAECDAEGDEDLPSGLSMLYPMGEVGEDGMAVPPLAQAFRNRWPALAEAGPAQMDLPWTADLRIVTRKYRASWVPHPPATYQEALQRQQRVLHGAERRTFLYLHRPVARLVLAIIQAAGNAAALDQGRATGSSLESRRPDDGAGVNLPGVPLGEAREVHVVAGLETQRADGDGANALSRRRWWRRLAMAWRSQPAHAVTEGVASPGGCPGSPSRLSLQEDPVCASVPIDGFTARLVRCTSTSVRPIQGGQVAGGTQPWDGFRAALNRGDTAGLHAAPLTSLVRCLEGVLRRLTQREPALSVDALRMVRDNYQVLDYGRLPPGPEIPHFLETVKLLGQLPPADQELLLLFAALVRHAARAGPAAGPALTELCDWAARLLLGGQLKTAPPVAREATTCFLWYLAHNDVAYASLILCRHQRLAGPGKVARSRRPGSPLWLRDGQPGPCRSASSGGRGTHEVGSPCGPLSQGLLRPIAEVLAVHNTPASGLAAVQRAPLPASLPAPHAVRPSSFKAPALRTGSVAPGGSGLKNDLGVARAVLGALF